MVEQDLHKPFDQYLKLCPLVAWCERMNVGRKGGVKFGFKGLSDRIGMLTTGQFLAIEAKRPGIKSPFKALSHDQLKFLKQVVENGGVAGVAQSIDDLPDILAGRHHHTIISTPLSEK